MRQATIHSWLAVHKWSSIVCTAFLLMLCLTGLPLIFHDEIDRLMGEVAVTGVASSGTDPALKPLDVMMAKALRARAGEVPRFMAFDNDGPLMTITTAPSAEASADSMTMQVFNRQTGAAAPTPGDEGPMHILLQLHTDMFLGLPGMFFLGFMGFLFVVALVSGAVLYAPFMRRLAFGTLRASRSRRLKWLDYHNLFGIVALAWAIIVGATGVINTLATPIMQLWQNTELAEMTRAYGGTRTLPPAQYASIDRAMAEARKAVPGANPQFIAFPGGLYSSKRHYAIFFQGDKPLTQHVLTPVLIDAQTSRLTAVRRMPWYNLALAYSQPLHFGDYGGLPLKLLWAILDLFTIAVLGSGLYLWLSRRTTAPDILMREVVTGGEAGLPT